MALAHCSAAHGAVPRNRSGAPHVMEGIRKARAMALASGALKIYRRLKPPCYLLPGDNIVTPISPQQLNLSAKKSYPNIVFLFFYPATYLF
jgi:hypothetical protein